MGWPSAWTPTKARRSTVKAHASPTLSVLGSSLRSRPRPRHLRNRHVYITYLSFPGEAGLPARGYPLCPRPPRDLPAHFVSMASLGLFDLFYFNFLYDALYVKRSGRVPAPFPSSTSFSQFSFFAWPSFSSLTHFIPQTHFVLDVSIALCSKEAGSPPDS